MSEQTVSDVPLYITELVGVLEAELRDLETTGGRLRDTIAHLRSTWGVSTLGPTINQQASPPLVQSAPPGEPAKPVRQARRPTAPAPVVTRRRNADRDADLARVMVVALSFGRPFRRGEIVAELGDVPSPTMQKLLRALVKDGRLSLQGDKSTARYTVVGKPGPVSSAPHTPAKAPQGDDAKQLRLSVMNVLDSGASYDVLGLIKGLRGVRPGVSEAELQPVLLELVNQRRILQISTDIGPRYRKKAA